MIIVFFSSGERTAKYKELRKREETMQGKLISFTGLCYLESLLAKGVTQVNFAPHIACLLPYPYSTLELV